ncbi:MAG: preprotein translocase subunit SecG [Bacteroidetes bacterium]|nr:preprotein translocase subunit SecG [Bacteroidota bacterium]
MYLLLSIIIIIVALLLGGIVLIQSSKGGGLAAGLGGANQFAGAQRTTEGLEKITWGFGAGLMFLVLLASFAAPKINTSKATETTVEESRLKDRLSTGVSVGQQPAPAANTTQPAATAAPAPAPAPAK